MRSDERWDPVTHTAGVKMHEHAAYLPSVQSNGQSLVDVS